MRFNPGQRCLVLHSVSAPDVIGTVITLGDWHAPDEIPFTPHGYWWLADPIIERPSLHESNLGEETAVIFAESWLMPIDDPDITEDESYEEDLNISIPA